MSRRYDLSGHPQNQFKVATGRVPYETLRQAADDFLGPNRSFDDLESWEQRALLGEIEDDMLGPELQLQIVPVTDYDSYKQ